MKRNATPSPYVDLPTVRRRFADELRRLVTGRKFKPAERVEFARMADAWRATLTPPDAQKAAVEAYAKATGADIITTLTEIESGKTSARPELAKALANARRSRATLSIPRLDRLARNIHFVSRLMESGVDFVCCDNPAANELTVHLLGCIVENGAEQISPRTVAALKAAKARCTLLGSARPGHWDGKEAERLAGLRKAQVKSRRIRHEKAIGVGDLLPLMQGRRRKAVSPRPCSPDWAARSATKSRVQNLGSADGKTRPIMPQ